MDSLVKEYWYVLMSIGVLVMLIQVWLDVPYTIISGLLMIIGTYIVFIFDVRGRGFPD
jgi:hypothetical protein